MHQTPNEKSNRKKKYEDEDKLSLLNTCGHICYVQSALYVSLQTETCHVIWAQWTVEVFSESL